MAPRRLPPASRCRLAGHSPMPGPSALPASMSIGDLTFAVRESDRRRTVGITVDRDGSLLLHAPAGIACRIASPPGPDPNAVWVFRKLAEKHLLLPARPDKEFVTGEGFDYLGRHYRLLLVRRPGRDRRSNWNGAGCACPRTRRQTVATERMR